MPKMPKRVVISIWSDLAPIREPVLCRIKLLAYRLGISAEAARVRLEEVGFHRTPIITYEGRG